MKQMKQFCNWLVRPHPGLTNTEDRRGAQLFSGLMLIQFTLVFLGINAVNLYYVHATGRSVWSDQDAWLVLAGLTVIGAAFVLLHQGFYKPAVMIYIVNTAAVALLAPLTQKPHAEIGLLASATIPVLLAAMVLSYRWVTGILIGILAVGITLLSLAFIPPRDAEIGLALLIVVAVTGGLILVLRYHLDSLEKERHSQIQEIASKYRNLFNGVADGIFILDMSGRVVEANPAACKQLQYAREELLGLSVASISVRPDFDFRGTISELRRNKSLSYITQHKRKDEFTFPVELRLSLVEHQGNTSILGVARDITERKRAEEELRESRALLRSVIDGTTDAIYVKDLEGRYKLLNAAAERTVGKSAMDVLGKDDNFLFSPPEAAAVIEGDRKVMEGQSAKTYEETLTDAAGKTVTYLSIKGPVFDLSGNVTGLFGIARDITERKRAEETLLESESRYHQLFNSVMEGIGVVDSNEIIQYCNPAFVDLFEATSQEELTGRCLLDFTPNDQRGKVLAQMEYRKKGLRGRHEFEIWTAKGNLKTVLASISPRFDDQNHYCGAFEAVIDITETKRLQELESRAQRLETAGQVAGQVAHDFNNMLAPMMAYPELIRDQLPEGDPGIKYLEAIEDAAQKIADLNQQLLTLSRRGHYNQEVLSLNAVLQQVLRDMAPLPETLVVETNLCADLMNINGGVAQLHRVVMNLVINARDAVQDIGRIFIKTENYYVDDTTICYGRVPRGEYAKITISDTGCGIPDEVVQKIFDPFFSTKSTDKKRGSGLGLSVVDAVVKDHDGYIDLSTRVGQGTSFYLYFPITRANVNAKPSDNIPCGAETILVIDDDEVQREVSARLLTTLGYKVAVCENGTRAVEMLKTRSFDLLILDMIMPNDIDGRETYRQALQIKPDQRAIIVSGFSESNTVAEVQRLGAGAFVKKPLSRKAIALAVRQELDRVPQPISVS